MMALVPEAAGSTDPYPSDDGGTHVDAPELRLFVMGLFFIFGGITSLNDVIIPKLKELFTLSFFEASLVQVWFFVAYAIVGIPGARLRSEEHTSELQSLMRISYAVFCLKKTKHQQTYLLNIKLSSAKRNTHRYQL